MFTYPVSADSEAVNAADFLHNICETILDVYNKKQDTPEFDSGVNEIVSILDIRIKKEAFGDYGATFGYEICETPQLTDEEKNKITEFKYNLLGPKKQKNEQTENATI